MNFDFVNDFAIVYEGGHFNHSTQKNGSIISDTNCKIINKKGYEIASGYALIERSGINTFTLIKNTNDGNDVSSEVKQLIPLENYIVVIDNAQYQSGFITSDGKFSEKFVFDEEKGITSTNYINAKYVGGGTWSAIDYEGNAVHALDFDLLKDKEKEKLLADN